MVVRDEKYVELSLFWWLHPNVGRCTVATPVRRLGTHLVFDFLRRRFEMSLFGILAVDNEIRLLV